MRRRIGVIFQTPRLIDDLTAFDNLALAVRAVGERPMDRRADISEALSWVGLRQAQHREAGNFRAQERRRLALARAVINRPDLLLADEPEDRVVLKLLLDLNGAGAALLVATSDAELARRTGGAITRMPLSADDPAPYDGLEAIP